jgi:hypothetical protein
MMETISLKDVPFKTRFRLENATVKRLKAEHSDYYYITNANVHLVYSYNPTIGNEILVTELALHDVYEALENPEFKAKIKAYVGN